MQGMVLGKQVACHYSFKRRETTMCGIVGYIGNRAAEPILMQGLSKLEYRGYDSAGIAVNSSQDELQIRKAEGKLEALQRLLAGNPCTGQIGIGHTRWATHGKPCNANSHPHTDSSGRFAVVHNGIVENHEELREQLTRRGHTFTSETDSEVIAHLVADAYKGDLALAVRSAVDQLIGTYALVVLSALEPDKLVAVKTQSPLVIGLGEKEHYIGSDIPAILDHTRNVLILDDREMAVLTRDHVEVFDGQGQFIVKDPSYVIWDAIKAEKTGYEHFMLKEIHEQPKAIRDTMRSRLNDTEGCPVQLKELRFTASTLRRINRIQLVACGTAYHAALVGKYVLERLLKLPVEVEIASEYRYRDPLITAQTLVIAVSQSGETADTLAAVQEARRHGALVVAITNVVGSSITREANASIFTWAGPEISVASTKAYTTQLIALYMLAIYLSEHLGTQNRFELLRLTAELRELPEKVEQILSRSLEIQRYANELADYQHVFYIGRGLDYAVALEGSLKIKEISYIHSEAYAAGELKHGTLALIEEGTPVIAIAAQDSVIDKTINNIKEVQTRGASVFGISSSSHSKLLSSLDKHFVLPETSELLVPVLTVIPLQLLAYYTSLARGLDVDKPRNLAKSVTVE
jgi:glucosamine--fructose-6-phosphate aminotransferase (isomerizing)